MGKKNAPHMSRLLPQVLLATFAVSILPVLLVWKLSSHGVITSMGLLIGIGVAVSFGLGWICRVYWEASKHPSDLLFGELMLWGFLRRWRTESRLANATKLLGLSGKSESSKDRRLSSNGGLSRVEQARLLKQLASALEARDPYTHGHSRRVARHAAMIAKTMGLPDPTVNEIRAAAAIHDVGKIDTPQKVLHKPGRLTNEEFDVIKQHPVRGAEMIMERDLPEAFATIVAHHHERIDGTGYPDGLSGDEIPLGARIIAVADTFDALTSQRPYRSARPHKKALQIINGEAGVQLDPDAVRAFCSHYSGMRPLAVWVTFTHLPQRFLFPVLSELQASAASAAKVAAVTAAAAGVSAVAAAPAVENTPVQSTPIQVAAEQAASIAPDPRDSWQRPEADPSSATHRTDGNGNAGVGDGSASGSTGSGSSQSPGQGASSGGGGSSSQSGSGGGDSGSDSPDNSVDAGGNGIPLLPPELPLPPLPLPPLPPLPLP
jgi:putative nucleotidyltransferase with HDIG domain